MRWCGVGRLEAIQAGAVLVERNTSHADNQMHVKERGSCEFLLQLKVRAQSLLPCALRTVGFGHGELFNSARETLT